MKPNPKLSRGEANAWQRGWEACQSGYLPGWTKQEARERWESLSPARRKEILRKQEEYERSGGYYTRIPKLEENPRRRRRRLSKHCQQIVSRTAAQEIRSGYPRAQAVAIGYSKARAAGCRVPAPRRLQDNPTAFWGKFLG